MHRCSYCGICNLRDVTCEAPPLLTEHSAEPNGWQKILQRVKVWLRFVERSAPQLIAPSVTICEYSSAQRLLREFDRLLPQEFIGQTPAR